MGLFDKIKDNAKTISMKAIESTQEFDEEVLDENQPITARDDKSAEVPDDALAIAPTSTLVSAEDKTAQPIKTTAKVVNEDEDNGPVNVSTGTAKKNETSEDKTQEKPATEKSDKQPKEDKEENKQVLSRHSRITEVPKEPKTYRPFYKSSLPESEQKSNKTDSNKQGPRRNVLIDVSPQKIVDPVKRAIYDRERAALAALSNQRRMNGTVPLYSTDHMKFKTKVFINRIEYSGSFGRNTLPIEQIAWVKLRAAGTGVILETIEGKRVVMVIKPKDRLAFADAVLKVQELQPKKGKFKDTQTVRIDQLEKFGEGVDEIEKLAKLYDKGILTQEEFDAKKKQILGI